MINTKIFPIEQPLVIGAVHLPPFPASNRADAKSITEITDYALRNIGRAVKAGVSAFYLQDVGDRPVAPAIQPYTVAGMTAVGIAVRREFPDVLLGLQFLGHGAREPLIVAQVIGAQFVRIKVFVGVMIKGHGLLEGCAYEALQSRVLYQAQDVLILADVYDRSGMPLGRMPLVSEVRNAVSSGADGLVITGHSFDESLEMLAEVHNAGPTVPVFLGGSATAENISKAMVFADGVIVSSTFYQPGSRPALADWDEGRIAEFMKAVKQINK
jgi:membrane complex biogenesis BtpA family protein